MRPSKEERAKAIWHTPRAENAEFSKWYRKFKTDYPQEVELAESLSDAELTQIVAANKRNVEWSMADRATAEVYWIARCELRARSLAAPTPAVKDAGHNLSPLVTKAEGAGNAPAWVNREEMPTVPNAARRQPTPSPTLTPTYAQQSHSPHLPSVPALRLPSSAQAPDAATRAYVQQACVKRLCAALHDSVQGRLVHALFNPREPQGLVLELLAQWPGSKQGTPTPTIPSPPPSEPVPPPAPPATTGRPSTEAGAVAASAARLPGAAAASAGQAAVVQPELPAATLQAAALPAALDMLIQQLKSAPVPALQAAMQAAAPSQAAATSTGGLVAAAAAGPVISQLADSAAAAAATPEHTTVLAATATEPVQSAAQHAGSVSQPQTVKPAARSAEVVAVAAAPAVAADAFATLTPAARTAAVAPAASHDSQAAAAAAAAAAASTPPVTAVAADSSAAAAAPGAPLEPVQVAQAPVTAACDENATAVTAADAAGAASGASAASEAAPPAGVPAADSQLQPTGVIVDAAGAQYIAEQGTPAAEQVPAQTPAVLAAAGAVSEAAAVSQPAAYAAGLPQARTEGPSELSAAAQAEHVTHMTPAAPAELALPSAGTATAAATTSQPAAEPLPAADAVAKGDELQTGTAGAPARATPVADQLTAAPAPTKPPSPDAHVAAHAAGVRPADMAVNTAAAAAAAAAPVTAAETAAAAPAIAARSTGTPETHEQGSHLNGQVHEQSSAQGIGQGEPGDGQGQAVKAAHTAAAEAQGKDHQEQHTGRVGSQVEAAQDTTRAVAEDVAGAGPTGGDTETNEGAAQTYEAMHTTQAMRTAGPGEAKADGSTAEAESDRGDDGEGQEEAAGGDTDGSEQGERRAAKKARRTTKAKRTAQANKAKHNAQPEPEAGAESEQGDDGVGKCTKKAKRADGAEAGAESDHAGDGGDEDAGAGGQGGEGGSGQDDDAKKALEELRKLLKSKGHEFKPGWTIKLQKQKDRKKPRYLYISPTGEKFRSKASALCDTAEANIKEAKHAAKYHYVSPEASEDEQEDQDPPMTDAAHAPATNGQQTQPHTVAGSPLPSPTRSAQEALMRSATLGAGTGRAQTPVGTAAGTSAGQGSSWNARLRGPASAPPNYAQTRRTSSNRANNTAHNGTADARSEGVDGGKQRGGSAVGEGPKSGATKRPGAGAGAGADAAGGDGATARPAKAARPSPDASSDHQKTADLAALQAHQAAAMRPALILQQQPPQHQQHAPQQQQYGMVVGNIVGVDTGVGVSSLPGEGDLHPMPQVLRPVKPRARPHAPAIKTPPVAEQKKRAEWERDNAVSEIRMRQAELIQAQKELFQERARRVPDRHEISRLESTREMLQSAIEYDTWRRDSAEKVLARLLREHPELQDCPGPGSGPGVDALGGGLGLGLQAGLSNGAAAHAAQVPVSGILTQGAASNGVIVQAEHATAVAPPAQQVQAQPAAPLAAEQELAGQPAQLAAAAGPEPQPGAMAAAPGRSLSLPPRGQLSRPSAEGAVQGPEAEASPPLEAQQTGSAQEVMPQEGGTEEVRPQEGGTLVRPEVAGAQRDQAVAEGVEQAATPCPDAEAGTGPGPMQCETVPATA